MLHPTPLFRSSDRYIPANTLHSESWPKIGKDLLHQVGALSQDQLLQGIHTAALQHPELKIDQGVVENLLKIQQIYKLQQDAKVFSDRNGNVPGLEPDDVDSLVASFSPPPDRPADPSARARLESNEGEFDHVQKRAENRVATKMTNNDLYNFKIAADFWGNGLTDKYQVTASLFPRGHEKRPFMVSLGQEEVLDLLKNLHITEEEIQHLKSNPEFKDVPPGFWQYMRKFKFNGTIRGTRPGTIGYADEPIMEVTGNPVEVQIVETLIIPWINKMTNWATKAERVVREAGGRVVVEGGTRRGADGVFSAKAAIVGGATGTSNVETGMTWGVKEYGSQNHFSIMMFPTEADGHSAFLRFFPTSPLLADTNTPEDSVRQAILSYGPDLGMIRLDSTIPGKKEGDPGMTKAETAQWVRGLLDRLGYTHTKVTYSDGINEYELAGMPPKDAPFNTVLVGGELAAPSDTSSMNVVYKVSEVVNLETGEVFDPIKKASGKVSLPGQHAVWRVYDNDGKVLKDVITEINEPGPKGAKKLTIDLMIKGKDVLKRDPLSEQAAYVRKQVQELPKEQLDIDAKKIKNFAEISSGLKERQDTALARTSTEHAPEMVLVIPGSFSPPTEAHIKLIRGMQELYSNVKVVVVPSGDSNANGKTHGFTSKQRVAMLERQLGGKEAMKKAGIEIYTGEIEGKTKYSIDTLNAIQANFKAQGKDVDLSLVVGQDIFNGPNPKNLISHWDRVDQLFDNYNVIVQPREGQDALKVDHRTGKPDFLQYLPEEIQQKFVSKSAVRAENAETGKFIQLASVGAGNDSSTKLRQMYDAVDTVYLDASSTSIRSPMKHIALADSKGKTVTVREQGHPSSEHRVPHLQGKDGRHIASNYNPDAYADLYRDPRVDMTFEQSGASIVRNPHFNDLVNAVAPKRYVISGTCSDNCVDRTLQSVLARKRAGDPAEAIVISDGTTAINPAWKAEGVKVMTANQYAKKYRPELLQVLKLDQHVGCIEGAIADTLRSP